MYCRFCGKTFSDGVYCPYCGKKQIENIADNSYGEEIKRIHGKSVDIKNEIQSDDSFEDVFMSGGFDSFSNSSNNGKTIITNTNIKKRNNTNRIVIGSVSALVIIAIILLMIAGLKNKEIFQNDNLIVQDYEDDLNEPIEEANIDDATSKEDITSSGEKDKEIEDVTEKAVEKEIIEVREQANVTRYRYSFHNINFDLPEYWETRIPDYDGEGTYYFNAQKKDQGRLAIHVDTEETRDIFECMGSWLYGDEADYKEIDLSGNKGLYFQTCYDETMACYIWLESDQTMVEIVYDDWTTEDVQPEIVFEKFIANITYGEEEGTAYGDSYIPSEPFDSVNFEGIVFQYPSSWRQGSIDIVTKNMTDMDLYPTDEEYPVFLLTCATKGWPQYSNINEAIKCKENGNGPIVSREEIDIDGQTGYLLENENKARMCIFASPDNSKIYIIYAPTKINYNEVTKGFVEYLMSHIYFDGHSQKNSEVASSSQNISNSKQSAGINYVLNTNSMKFHKPTCSSVSDIADYNRQDVSWTRSEAIAEHYSPCKRCNP